MKNNLKVAALVAAVVIGMVLYKGHFERQEKAKKEAEDHEERKTSEKAGKRRWN